MLAVLQNIMKAPGGSATELLPSTSTPQDGAQVLYEQPSEDAPVLQGDILPKAQVCSNLDRLDLCCICLCQCLCLHNCLCPCIVDVGAFAGAFAFACAYCSCLCRFVVPVAFGLLPLLVTSAFSQVSRQLAALGCCTSRTCTRSDVMLTPWDLLPAMTMSQHRHHHVTHTACAHLHQHVPRTTFCCVCSLTDQ